MKFPTPRVLFRKSKIRKIIRNGLLIVVILQSGIRGEAQTSDSRSTEEEKSTTAISSEVKLDPLDRAHFHNQSASHYTYSNIPLDSVLAPWFFPPAPPALDEELPLLPPIDRGVSAPPGMGEFAGDFFYPLLATRLNNGELAKSVREELQAYRKTKLNLQNELHVQLLSLKDKSPESREMELSAFATQQAPRITELENLAEKIRTDLRRNDFLGQPAGNDDWAGIIRVRWQTATEDKVAQTEAVMFRAAAFYQDGLATAQRRLLLEASIELETKIRPRPTIAQPSQDVWVLPFSPEPARILLVANLPAALAKKISEYTTAKQSLKTELHDILLAQLNNNSVSRIAVLRELAGAQQLRIATLEVVAEEIRRDLAVLPNPPGPPAAPSLPPELMARIATYRGHKLELLKTLYALLAGNTKPIDPAVGTKAWMRDERTQTVVQPVTSQASTLEFNKVQTRLLAELNKEQTGIREALAQHFQTTNQPTDRKSINDLLKDFETARQKQELWEKYRDYQNAVLMPGLAPEQRRLLFDAAIEKLSLPLPAGEKIP